ncbi:hypothetical protein [Desulfoscipio gibsoniae]
MVPEKIRQMPKQKILKALLEGKIKQEDIMTAFKIRAREGDLMPDALGFVYKRSDGCYFIVTDQSLSPTIREEIINHEIFQILVHLPKMPYTVGLNIIQSPIERQADSFAREVAVSNEED